MQRIVFIGIGGIGLSAIAHIMVDCGITNIIGIDGNIDQESLRGLKNKGVQLFEHGTIECKTDDIVLYSDAVFTSVEYKTYRSLGGTMFSYFDFAGELSKHFKTISVAGSHGKSTTTAMAISAMNKLVPEFGIGIVGALMKEFDGQNYVVNSDYKEYINQVVHGIINPLLSIPKLSSPPYFVIEADEFNRHFHKLDTDIALITNIEHDHTDVYPNKEDYFEAFQYFVDRVKSKVIAHPSATHEINIPNNKLIITSSHHFDFTFVFGAHNQANANLVYSLVEYINQTDAQKAHPYKVTIESFPGIRRRQEFLWKGSQGALISDYAHHPTEVKATFDAVKLQFPDKKIIGIFQPHQAARVLEFEQEFVNSVSGFDELYIFPIYAAREDYHERSQKYPQLAKAGSFAQYGKVFADHCGGILLENYDQAWEIIDNQKDKAIVVMMTAGNLDWEIRKRLS